MGEGMLLFAISFATVAITAYYLLLLNSVQIINQHRQTAFLVWLHTFTIWWPHEAPLQFVCINEPVYKPVKDYCKSVQYGKFSQRAWFRLI